MICEGIRVEQKQVTEQTVFSLSISSPVSDSAMFSVESHFSQ